MSKTVKIFFFQSLLPPPQPPLLRVEWWQSQGEGATYSSRGLNPTGPMDVSFSTQWGIIIIIFKSVMIEIIIILKILITIITIPAQEMLYSLCAAIFILNIFQVNWNYVARESWCRCFGGIKDVEGRQHQGNARFERHSRC